MAILEVAFVGLLGLVPLFSAPFLRANDPEIGISAATSQLIKLVSLGQLYLYCFALIATLSWLFIQHNRGAHIFFRAIMGFSILVISIASISIYLQNPALSRPLAHHLVILSGACYALCLLIYFFLLMCGSAVAPAPTIAINEDVKSLIDRTKGVL